MSVARLRLRQARGLAFVALALALAPFHTAVIEGQLAIAVTALVVAALHAELHDHPLASGLCIAAAAVLRPQMALIYVLLLLLRGRWKALAGALAGISVLVGLGAGRMALAGVDWAPVLLSNLTRAGVADPARATTTQRLSLHALLDVLMAGQAEAAILAVTYGIGLAGLAALLLRLRHRSDREAALLLYAGCAVITLLLAYNRSYSATLLVLPLAWAFAPFRPRSLRAVAVVLCLAIAVFFVPGGAALSLVPSAAVPGWLGGWWPILQLHQVLALIIALAAILEPPGPGWTTRRPLSTLLAPARRGHLPIPPPGASKVDSPRRARRGTSGALYLQSAPAGLNSLPRSAFSRADGVRDVEDRVPRSGDS